MHSESKTKIIVLTGGIGSGKSTVAACWAEAGMPVYEADARAKHLYVENPRILEQIEDVLDIRLRNAEGEFDKCLLAERLFVDGTTGDIALLEGILFPALTEDFNRFVESLGYPLCVAFESATVLEKDFFRGFGDFTVVVDAPADIRLARACRRDRASEEDIAARMARQPLMNRISAGEVPDFVDAVILNDSSEEALRIRAMNVIREFYPDCSGK